MKVVKLGENLYEIRLPFWCWSYKMSLIRGLLEIQGYGKVVTAIRGFAGFGSSYVVVTS